MFIYLQKIESLFKSCEYLLPLQTIRFIRTFTIIYHTFYTNKRLRLQLKLSNTLKSHSKLFKLSSDSLRTFANERFRRIASAVRRVAKMTEWRRFPEGTRWRNAKGMQDFELNEQHVVKKRFNIFEL